ncbi:pseudouridine synthase [Actinomyces vulturis]|uniref:pseudouridine synthase n=1 Tax=Actinomyces vulturis TaxID=1857645 RepID=UPI0008317832|nr:pseudouridine synthase [Actinomyces vulturis]
MDHKPQSSLDFGDEEFYDDDDLEFFPDNAPDADLAAFDREARQAEERDRQREHADQVYVPNGQRLNKILAHAGVASRRMCERYITDGRVSVDGIVVRDLGVRVDPTNQRITVDGQRIIADPSIITLMLNKPAGVVCTMDDPQGRPTVADMARDYCEENGLGSEVRLVHVGRLDTATEGLLLLSNDGELSHRLMHPRYEISKTYVAIVKGQMERGTARQLMRGIDLDDGPIAADKVSIRQATPQGSIIHITLHSGRNRIVRRMCEAVGHPVTRLSRTALGPLTLGPLHQGHMRQLTSQEITDLSQAVGL